MASRLSSVRRRLVWIVPALVLIAIYPVDVLTLDFPHSHHAPLILARAAAGRQVVLTYIHSVEGTPVEGVFRMGAQRCFEIQQTRYTSVGTGLPTASANQPHREGEWFVVEEDNRRLESIRFFAIPENRVRITVGATTVNMEDFQVQGLIVLQIEPVSRIRWWWNAFGKSSPT